MELNQQMDKLIKVSLVNWHSYLKEDVFMFGDITVITGSNGAGKSSFMDALKTILAGGDEKEIVMNAAGNDVHRTERDIRSYALGFMTPTTDSKKYYQRKTTNTYISMTFRRKNGTYWSAGIAIYAKINQQKIDKNTFIIDNYELSVSDFLESENISLPWKDVEKRLSRTAGVLELQATVKEYKYRLAELMSAEGPNCQIHPNMMLQALKKGISFKEEKCISSFIRNHILPEKNIDVFQIQLDYKQYEDIQKTITEGKKRLQDLNNIKKHFDKVAIKKQSALINRWCIEESSVREKNDEIEEKQNEYIINTQALVINERALSDSKEKKNILQGKYDEALVLFKSSDIYKARKAIKDKIIILKENREKDLEIINNAKQRIAALINIDIQNDAKFKTLEKFKYAQEQLKKAAKFEGEDLINSWCKNEQDIYQIKEILDLFQELEGEIKNERDKLRYRKNIIEEEKNKYDEIQEKLKIGDAPLNFRTHKMMEILSENGIKAEPVCNFCTISDSEWQIAIENYLGINREALVIPESDFKRAAQILYLEKIKDNEVSQVKIINPLCSMKIDNKIDTNMAGSLIETDNNSAKKFILGLLFNVKLVNSIEEICYESNAITKDGMVAKNGVISGGNGVSYAVMGHEARKMHKDKIKSITQKLGEDLLDINTVFEPIDKLNTNLSQKIQEARSLVNILWKHINSLDKNNNGIQEYGKKLSSLEGASYLKLEKEYIEAQNNLNKHGKENSELLSARNNLENKITQLDNEIPKIKEKRNYYEKQRADVEKESNFDAQKAIESYEKLEVKLGETSYSKIRSVAEKKNRNLSEAADEAKAEGIKVRTEYLCTYEPEDYQEFTSLSDEETVLRCTQHIERIEQTEMLSYEEDSKQASKRMLDNFRSEVVAKLKENFDQLESTFSTLNLYLEGLSFNDLSYKFTYSLKDTGQLRQVHEYIDQTSQLEIDMVDSLFDASANHPVVEIIEDILVGGNISEIIDYRDFYTFDIISTKSGTDIPVNYSDIAALGSVGERHTPLYVALGASFMSAYRVRRFGDAIYGGVALALFDEAFSSMDSNNAQTALKFFREIGLQVILAAPPEIEVKIGPYTDCVYSVIKSGNSVHLDFKSYTEDGRKLLESDNPIINDSIIPAFIDQVRKDYDDEKFTQ